MKNLSVTLASKLDSKEYSESELDRSAQIHPRDTEARRLYFEGLERLRSFDANAAKEKLEQTVELADGSVAAHAALAEAWLLLKHDREAALQGEKAADLADAQSLPAELVQSIEARSAELGQHWANAAERYKALHDFFPGQLGYALGYANSLTKSGHPLDSVHFLDTLQLRPSPIGDDPRIQFARANAFAAESSFTEELKAAKLSLEYAGRRKEKLMRAAANLQVCWAQQNASNLPEALQACQDASNIYSTFDDSVNAAVALNGIANIKQHQADFKGARDTYLKVLAIVRQANSQIDTCGALLNLARTEIYLGEDAEAEANLLESVDLSSKVEDHADESKARILLAQVFYDADKRDASERQDKLALEIAEQVGDRDTQAYALSNLGQLALDSRNMATAEAQFAHALRLREEIGEPAGIIRL